MTLTINEQIAPEIAQALIAQAIARGLTVNGYLRHAGTARCWEWMTSRKSRRLPKETAAHAMRQCLPSCQQPQRG